ncbi:hypothetical protein HOU43_gp66 [Cronobacter phage CS01]|uniref:Lipoprotein n=1 Tax=Cronobacter phage CS01 TaxID=2496544 RepID=A0A3B8DJI5_9CAUD|nr:hypothetical protein HOU43_gp66 [Cronobacter phage CS01]AYJ73354.1 hypothetical protein CS01_066 [Cronobacter phage CS01]
MKRIVLSIIVSMTLSACSSTGFTPRYQSECESLGAEYAFTHGDRDGQIISEVCKRGARAKSSDVEYVSSRMADIFYYVPRADIKDAVQFGQLMK